MDDRWTPNSSNSYEPSPKTPLVRDTETAGTRRAVAYARFSSDLQQDRSIDDQVVLCRQHAEREGLAFVKVYSDRARSGASMIDRDGLVALLRDAKDRQFDMLIVESLDRLSRDQEDLANIFKRLRFYEVEIVTLNEGTATQVHIGIRGLVGSLFLADLAQKVRRGHLGRVREGKTPGAVAYGFRTVPGQPGVREIDPDTAPIVRRIYEEYAAGRSPRAIAADLNQEGIRAPRGERWNHTTLTRGGRGHLGIVANPTYTGKLEWGRTRRALNPDTGRKVQLATAESDVVVVDAPHMRIISDELFEAAQAVRQARGLAMWGPNGKPKLGRPRIESALSGLLRCGACGNHMRMTSTNRRESRRIVCSEAYHDRACSHRKTYTLSVVEDVALRGLQETLSDPDYRDLFVQQFVDESREAEKRARREKGSVERQLAEIDGKILRLSGALEMGSMPLDVIGPRLQALEAERVSLRDRARVAERDTQAFTLDPEATKGFLTAVEALRKGKGSARARQALRVLVNHVLVMPTGKRQPYDVRVIGHLRALLGLDSFPRPRTVPEILAEEGLSYCDNVHFGKAMAVRQ